MTDLEELWESYPEGRPPIAELLRAARAEARARRRRHLVRPLLVGATAAAVASGFVLGGHVGDGGGGSASTADGGAGGDSAANGVVSPELRHSAFQASLKPADSCAQVLASYQDRARQQVGAYGWNWGGFGAYDELRGTSSLKAPMAAAGQAASADGASIGGVANDPSGTNNQEAGVDEPDLVKTNGTLLVRATRENTIKVYDVSGDQVRLDASLDLPHLSAPELLLDGATLVALGTDTLRAGNRDGSGTRVDTVSLADPQHPAITSQVRYSGGLDTARLQGSDVHLVLADGLPDLPFVYPHDARKGDLSPKEALERNRAIVKETTLDDWLPRVDDGSGSRPLLACDHVAMPPDGVSLGTESVVGFSTATPTEPAAIGIAGTTSISYESADHLYLTTGGLGGCIDCVRPLGGMVDDVAGKVVGGMPYGGDGKTTIFQFDLAGTSATHVATGTLEGSIADRWSMDEAGGVLRVATTSMTRSGNQGRQQSSVVTLRPEGAKLTEIGRLDGLGVDETLTAARWFDDLAILSTARETDPLFTVDLGDPEHPKLLGALHIPGFSSYFHPLGDGQLLGIGQEVAFSSSGEREKAQVGLFDIRDLTDVKQVAVDSLRQWTWPVAADDTHAFTWLPDRHTAITTFRTRNDSMLLGVYTVDGSTLAQKLTPLEGRRYDMVVRTMELPNGKVVLMAGDRVSFLEI